ncbi:MAG: RNA polymerase sigma factor [Verrucomicrobiota bacterium]|nr:RNA polymerase sigma factor [Verrucomicrobiota bacterium]
MSDSDSLQTLEAMSDEQLMGQVVLEDPRALKILMHRWELRLRKYLLRLLNDQRGASMVAKDAFVCVYVKRAKYNPAKPFSHWLYGIATNEARSYQRWWKAKFCVSRDALRTIITGNPGKDSTGTRSNGMLEPADSGLSPDVADLHREKIEAVRKAISSLPIGLREPLILAEYEDKGYTEIAAILNITPKAVETRLRRARVTMKLSLQKYFDDSP